MVKNYYYDKIWKRYRIQKKINNKYISYGSYNTPEEAAQVVEKLNECQWDKKELPRILKDLNIKSKIK